MDEWLTAGDARFLAKAQQRIEEFVRHSSILVLASHSMQLVEEWCSHGLLLDHGRALAIGPIGEVLAAYRDLIAGESEQELAPSMAAV